MEPAFIVESAKIVGSPAEGFWSQVHSFFPQDSVKKEKRGDLLAVLVLSEVEGVDAVALGREVLGRLHEEYYGNLEGSAFERLGVAVKRVCAETQGVEIVAAALLGCVLYLAISGFGKVVLKRGDKIGVVLQGSGQIQTGSGILEAGDLVLLGSERFFQVVGFGVIKAALQNNSLEEAVESLAPIILGRSNMGDAAVIFALMKPKDSFSVASVSQFAPEEVVLPPKRELKINFWEKIFGKIKFPERKSFFIRRAEAEKRKRTVFVLSLVLLAFLFIILGLGFRRKLALDRQNKIKDLFSLAEVKFNEGKKLYLSNPAEGKAVVSEAKLLLDEGLAKNKGNPELLLLKEQVEKFLASTGTEKVLTEVPVFMDLTLVADGASGISMTLLGKDLVVLDKEKKKIYAINTEKKSSRVYESPEAGQFITAFDHKLIVFGEKGIMVIDTESKSASLKITKDEGWRQIVGFSEYNGNLYLLDKGASDIWRYLASGEDYGTRKSWFAAGSPDLSKAVSMAIDGSIWVLEEDKISKFTLSKADSFSLSKMPENFENPVKIYTSEDEQNLYVLDKGRRKIFMIAKSGEFKAAYTWEGMKEASDLVAAESTGKIFLLSGAKIYEIGTK